MKHETIDRLVAGINETFRVLADIQFSAPWQREERRYIRAA